MHQVFYTEHARRDLLVFEKKTMQRIVKKISFYAQQKRPLNFAKRLTNSSLGQYRFRIGDYRAIFDVNSKGQIFLLMILCIRHRKDVYDL